MVEINKIFRGSDQFNAVAKQFLMDNKNWHEVNHEYRLYLPSLCDIAPGKSTCININVQRYKSCLVRICHAPHANLVLVVLDQFDNVLYQETSGNKWIEGLYHTIKSNVGIRRNAAIQR